MIILLAHWQREQLLRCKLWRNVATCCGNNSGRARDVYEYEVMFHQRLRDRYLTSSPASEWFSRLAIAIVLQRCVASYTSFFCALYLMQLFAHSF